MGDNSANQIQPSPDHLREISRTGRLIGNRFVEKRVVDVKHHIGTEVSLRDRGKDNDAAKWRVREKRKLV